MASDNNQLELIQCEYNVVGCEERMACKDQEKHNKEKMEQHLSLIIRQLPSTQQTLAEILRIQVIKEVKLEFLQELTACKPQVDFITNDLNSVQHENEPRKSNKSWFYGICALSVFVVLLAFFIHSLSDIELHTKI